MATMQIKPQPFPAFPSMQTPHPCCGTGKSCLPTHDEIAHRAYDIYVASDHQQGQCARNWHQAEQQLIHASGTALATPVPFKA